MKSFRPTRECRFVVLELQRKSVPRSGRECWCAHGALGPILVENQSEGENEMGVITEERDADPHDISEAPWHHGKVQDIAHAHAKTTAKGSMETEATTCDDHRRFEKKCLWLLGVTMSAAGMQGLIQHERLAANHCSRQRNHAQQATELVRRVERPSIRRRGLGRLRLVLKTED